MSNGDSGMYLYGLSHLVKDCTASKNGLFGILTGGESIMTGNTAYGNGANGISTSSGGVITNNKQLYLMNYSGLFRILVLYPTSF